MQAAEPDLRLNSHIVRGPMRVWEAASLGFFLYVAAIASLPNRVRAPVRPRLYAGVVAGLLFVYGVTRVPYYPLLHDWLAPPVALLIAYWTSGLLFVAAVLRQETFLIGIDRRLRIVASASRMPSSIAVLLEAAYAAVYPVIPLALIIHLGFTPNPSPERFWSVILLTDFVCFGALAWVQTRPPRAIEAAEPWDSGVRRFNLQMLCAASIQVNTFPSGHAAEALAAALLVLGAPWPMVFGMLVIAVGISAGAVYGRYHYAADVLAGWAVAVAVWWMLR
jgi:membrane-associated phospholipid phosphatase